MEDTPWKEDCLCQKPRHSSEVHRGSISTGSTFFKNKAGIHHLSSGGTSGCSYSTRGRWKGHLGTVSWHYLSPRFLPRLAQFALNLDGHFSPHWIVFLLKCSFKRRPFSSKSDIYGWSGQKKPCVGLARSALRVRRTWVLIGDVAAVGLTKTGWRWVASDPSELWYSEFTFLTRPFWINAVELTQFQTSPVPSASGLFASSLIHLEENTHLQTFALPPPKVVYNYSFFCPLDSE